MNFCEFIAFFVDMSKVLLLFNLFNSFLSLIFLSFYTLIFIDDDLITFQFMIVVVSKYDLTLTFVVSVSLAKNRENVMII